MIQETLENLLGPKADPVGAGYHLRALAEIKPEETFGLFAAVAASRSEVANSDPAIVGGLLRVLHLLALKTNRTDLIQKLSIEDVCQIESALPPKTLNRFLLHQLLAIIGTAPALGSLVESLKFHPPDKWMEAAQIISPLMQSKTWPVEAVFPEILSCIASRSLAAPIIDLANFVTRTGRAKQHPATGQVQALNHLLGEVGHRLAQFEENPRAFGDNVETVQDTLGQAVALAVSLCDAVALIGDDTSIGKLNQVVELRHRRVQCEAAGGLARFGNEEGKKRLIELSEDPAARLRAIHYADELGFGDMIDDDFRSETSTAEAEMALWLSQPSQMGVPPTKVEVVESRHLMWPSFNDPVDVYLVRFEYNFGDRTFSNVGVTGPTVFTLSADVADLPADDIFAIYAGWHAEHEDIFSVPTTDFNDAQRRQMQMYQQHLDRLGYESLGPELLGIFLDEQCGVFSAISDETQCLVITDGLETIDQPTAGRLRPFGPTDLFHLYKGRKMLRTFNPQSDDDI